MSSPFLNRNTNHTHSSWALPYTPPLLRETAQSTQVPQTLLYQVVKPNTVFSRNTNHAMWRESVCLAAMKDQRGDLYENNERKETLVGQCNKEAKNLE